LILPWPYFYKFIICLYLSIFDFRLLQEGYRQVLVDIQTSAQLYNNLHLGWTKHSDRAPAMAPLIAIYSLVVSLFQFLSPFIVPLVAINS